MTAFAVAVVVLLCLTVLVGTRAWRHAIDRALTGPTRDEGADFHDDHHVLNCDVYGCESGSARAGLLICAPTALGTILAAPHVVGYLARTPEALAAVAVAVAWWVGVALERRYDRRHPMVTVPKEWA